MATTSPSVTVNFQSIQTTTIYQHNSLKTEEANKLTQMVGVGREYIAGGFELDLQYYIDGIHNTMYAKLTKGIFVQDDTIINFYNSMEADEIVLRVYNAGNVPAAGDFIYIGSQYYHGTIGDGINAIPTYSTILVTRSLTSYDNFLPFYKLIFLPAYNGINDTTNIRIERVIPSLKYNGCGIPIIKYLSTGDNLPVYGDDRTENDGLIWALVMH